jgi:predicted nucleotidyltransferase
VDLIAEFDKTKRLSLLGKIGIENRLSELLGIPVELPQKDLLKEPVRMEADREAVLAF